MSKTDPRVDAFIEKAPSFAQPILREYRKRVHAAHANLSETIKWNVPFFLDGEKVVANMASFKKHTKLGVWSKGTGVMGKPDFVDATLLDQVPTVAQLKKLLAANVAKVAKVAKKKSPAKKKK